MERNLVKQWKSLNVLSVAVPFSSTRHGLDVHSNVSHKTIHRNGAVSAPFINILLCLTIERYPLDGMKMLKVKNSNAGDTMVEIMAWTQPPKYSFQIDYSRLPDIWEFCRSA